MLQAGSLRSLKNLMTIVKLLARDIQTAVITREIVQEFAALALDHFRNGCLGEVRECGNRGVCC